MTSEIYMRYNETDTDPQLSKAVMFDFVLKFLFKNENLWRLNKKSAETDLSDFAPIPWTTKMRLVIGGGLSSLMASSW